MVLIRGDDLRDSGLLKIVRSFLLPVEAHIPENVCRQKEDQQNFRPTFPSHLIADPDQKKEKGKIEEKSFSMKEIHREMIELGEIDFLQFQKMLNLFMAQN
jgi:hypothetical protein